jgi:hypothetical protein
MPSEAIMEARRALPLDEGATRIHILYMRILITGDCYWACLELAAEILRRLTARYGPDLMIVRGDATGVEESFGAAAKGFGLTVRRSSHRGLLILTLANPQWFDLTLTPSARRMSARSRIKALNECPGAPHQ